MAKQAKAPVDILISSILKLLPERPLLKEFAQFFLASATTRTLQAYSAKGLAIFVEQRFEFFQKATGHSQETIRVDYGAIKKNQKPDVFLQAFDVIEVPEAGIFSGPRIIQTLVGAASGSLGTMFSQGGTTVANRVLY